jgi:lipoic acid synthetase
MTMVNRDDLLDGGADHVARTVARLRALRADILIETLVGDFMGRGGDIDAVVDASPDVFAHNVEVTRAMTRTIRDARCGYDQSLEVLRRAKQRGLPRRLFTKSSIMVGIGETDDEVLETLWDLRAVGVDIVTLGQYLQPSPRHAPVARYVTPEQFADYKQAALEMGFAHAASGPLVRSSYKAAEVFVRSTLRPGHDGDAEVEAELSSRIARAQSEASRIAADARLTGVALTGVADGAALPLSEAHLAGALIPAAALRRKPAP